MKKIFTVFVMTGGLLLAGAQVNTVNFDDLAPRASLTGTTYGGVFWEQGNRGYNGNIGGWGIPWLNVHPHSEPNAVVNSWGSTLTGLRFSSAVDVLGAYFAGQGDISAWTTGVRVHGYLEGTEVATTAWFSQIGLTPTWFDINLHGVDRIVVESVPVVNGGGWFGMDDFTYAVPEPGTAALLLLGFGLFARRKLVRGGFAVDGWPTT